MTRCFGAVAFGVLVGLAIAVVAPWIVFNVHDVDCSTLTPPERRLR